MRSNFISKYAKFFVVAVYILSVVIRSHRLWDTSVFVDETIWVVNSKELLYSILKHNFAAISQMWWNKTDDLYAIGIPAVYFSGLSYMFLAGAGKYSLHLLNDIVAARLPVLLIGSLTAPILFIKISKYFDQKVAALTAVTYAISPIAIGLDRWLVFDSYLTLFTVLAVFSIANTVQGKKLSLVTGIWIGLAFLTKPIGVLLVIPLLFVLFITKDKKYLCKQIVLSLFGFVLIVTLLWPQSWIEPVIAIFKYLFLEVSLHSVAKLNYYMGRSVMDPGWTYYPFLLLTKTPEAVLIGLFLGLFSLRDFNRIDKPKKLLFQVVSIFIFVLMLLLTISPLKLGIRYVLPVLPWLYLLSSAGLIGFLSKLKNNFLKIILIIEFIIGFLFPLSYFPNYYNYYNLLVGGMSGATKFDRNTYCLGNKKSLEFLDQKGFSGKVYIFGCADSGRYHSNREQTRQPDSADLYIVESTSAKTEPNNPNLQYILKNKTPIQNIYENGTETATIYR